MIRHIKVALGAAAFLCASQANAANFLIVDIFAVGSGTTFRNVDNTVVTYNFKNFYASLSYYLEGSLGPKVDGNTLTLIGGLSVPSVSGTFDAEGFRFSAISPDPRSGYTIGGSGCYANSSPTTITIGSPTLDPSCGSIAVFNNSGGRSSYQFNGSVAEISFRVVEADGLPGVTFAIPEPATWALMLAGFAMTGYALRRRRARVAFA